MDLSKYTDQLREGLASATAAADEQTQRTAMLLGAAVEPTARLALMNALSDLAAEVTAALGDRVVEVRLDGRDVRVAVSDPARGDATDGATGGSERTADDGTGGDPDDDRDGSSWGGRGFGRGFGGGFGGGFGPDGGDISRVTLRLVEQMKNQAERAAAEQGMSLNSWVAQAVQGALSGHGPGRWDHGRGDQGRPGKRDRRSERRVKGWVQG
jgi:HicB family